MAFITKYVCMYVLYISVTCLIEFCVGRSKGTTVLKIPVSSVKMYVCSYRTVVSSVSYELVVYFK